MNTMTKKSSIIAIRVITMTVLKRNVDNAMFNHFDILFNI